jgi:hypothetical protein
MNSSTSNEEGTSSNDLHPRKVRKCHRLICYKDNGITYRSIVASNIRCSTLLWVHEDRKNITLTWMGRDRLCGLVLRFTGYRSRDPGFDPRRYPIFWEVVGLKRGPLSLVSITEELIKWKSSGSGSRRPRLTLVRIRCADHATPSIGKKLALTKPISGGRLVDIFRLRTKSTEFF